MRGHVGIAVLAGALLVAGCQGTDPGARTTPAAAPGGASGAADSSREPVDSFTQLGEGLSAACSDVNAYAMTRNLVERYGPQYYFATGRVVQPSPTVCEFATVNSNTGGPTSSWSAPLRFAAEEGPYVETVLTEPMGTDLDCRFAGGAEGHSSAVCLVDENLVKVSWTFYTEEFSGTSNRLTPAAMNATMSGFIDVVLGSATAGEAAEAGPERAVEAGLDDLIDDRTAADAAAVEDVAQALFADLLDTDTQAPAGVGDLVDSELAAAGMFTYAAPNYHPGLRALMLLGSGAHYGIVLDELGDPVPDRDVRELFDLDLSAREWVPQPEKAAEIESNGYYVGTCDTGMLLRTGPGVWTSISDRPNELYPSLQNLVMVRDVTALSLADRIATCT